MARNTTLANALLMLKGEINVSLTSGVAAAMDQHFYTLIDNKQKWLASEYDWPFLKEKKDVSLVGGTRYYTLPTEIIFERMTRVDVLYNQKWEPVDFGIGPEEYNCYSSGDGSVPIAASDPTLKWDWKDGDETQIEVWPIPVAASTLRFSGQRVLTDLKNGTSNYVTSQTLDIDDLLVVKFVAADYLSAQDQKNSQLKLAEAEIRLNRIRAVYPQKDEKSRAIIFGGGRSNPPIKVNKLVLTA